MKKMRLPVALLATGVPKKMWRIMRLTFILVFCVAMSVSARTYSQSKRVTLDVKDASASQLFDEIKRQCDYSFFFNEDNLSELNDITLTKSDVTVKEVLDEVFS